jgi:hypothetical protein
MGTHQCIHTVMVTGMLLLIITSTIISSVPIADITVDDDRVTMSVHAYGGAEDTIATVRVTKQQLRELHAIFDTLKDRLSTAASQQETERIFDETIIELDRYHLLPEGMSVEHAQRIVTHAVRQQNKMTILRRLSPTFTAQTKEGFIRNTFCTIAGNTTNTHFAKLAKRTALRLYYIIDFSTGNALLVKIATAMYVVCRDISKINQLFLQQDGRHLGVSFYYGNYHYAPYPNWLSPATGWIETDGRKGKQNISGSFWGQTMTGGWQPQVDWYMNYSWRGCLGFTGLILYDDIDTAYYLGSALAVNVGPNRP